MLEGYGNIWECISIFWLYKDKPKVEYEIEWSCSSLRVISITKYITRFRSVVIRAMVASMEAMLGL